MKTCLRLASVVTLLCGATLAIAQTSAPDAPKAADILTEDSLHTMLKNMGYNVGIEKTPQGNIYMLTIKRDTWTYVLDVSLSPSKTKLWFSGWLKELPKDGTVTVDRLLDLLEANWLRGPYHFRYHRAFHQLNIALCLDNQGITPAVLRTQLEGFMDTMKSTETLWNPKKWEGSKAAAVK